MIINRNSWHYRLLKFWDVDHPSSLCPYFWKTVWCIIISTLIVGALSFITFGALYGLGFMYYFGNHSSGFIDIVLSVGFIGQLKIVGMSILITVIFITAICLLLYALISDFRKLIHGLIYENVVPAKNRSFDDYDQYYYEKTRQKRALKAASEPSLLRTFIKARKEKLCPMLEFK